MNLRGVLTLLTIAIMLAGIAASIWAATNQRPKPLPINELAQLIKHGQIASIEVNGQDGVATTVQQQAFGLRVDEPGSLPQLLERFGVTADQLSSVNYSVAGPPAVVALEPLATALVPIVLLCGLAVLALRGPGKPTDLMNFGKARARVFEADRPRTTFADVAGVDEAKHELQEVVEFLKAPDRFTTLGARLPRGVLLVGPPGTGKTLLARAVAGEAGVAFSSIPGSQFVEMFVGVGASRVRDLFAQARRTSPCIVFVDEIDAVGRRRGAGSGGGNDEREQTLNQLLVEMDGFDSRTNIIVIAATNRPDVLDQALLRPGRFDRQVQVSPPDARGRTAVLEVHARGKPLEPAVDLAALAHATPGFSGADLANVMNEAAILAARRRGTSIHAVDIEEAVDRVLAGPAADSRIMSEPERRLTAYHEAGHAVVARFLERHDPVHKITIVGRGRAGGYTRFLPREDRYYQTRSQFAASIASAVGGHAAEAIIFGEVTTGASSDLERATALARRMVTEFGMSELGVVTLGATDGDSKGYSEHTARQIDEEVRRLVDEAYAHARRVILEQRAVLDRVAHGLRRWETLQGAELERAFTGEPSAVIEQAQDERSARSPAPSVSPRLLPAAAMRISPGGRDA